MARLLWSLVLAIAISGCTTFSKSKKDGALQSQIEEGVQIGQQEASSRQVVENIQRPYVSPLGPVALDENEMVDQWVRYFQGRGRKHMEVYLERSSRYLPMMKNVLRENGLPEELVYVALIESGFSPKAHSRANAVGYWQFIRETGRFYGLKIDRFVDERRDPVLSTRAAVEYFKSLYNLFGSWHLSLAAYNSGENRIKRAVMTRQTRDFWQLAKWRKALPKETKQYVPKFIAATLIAQAPEKYGFTDIAYSAPLNYETISSTKPISLSRMAAEMKVDEEELRVLNPKFRGDYVPVYRGNEIVLRVPVGTTQAAMASLSSSVVSEVPNMANTDNIYYRIRSGDSLSTIARKHRTSVATLRRMNDLGSRALLRVGQKLLVPDRGDYYYGKSAEKASYPGAVSTRMTAAVDIDRNVSFHIVRRGDSLTQISRTYGVSIEELRRLNNLGRRSVLRVGQRLRLKEDEQAQNKTRTQNIKIAKANKVLKIPKRRHEIGRAHV